jgi:hypothetical protein
MRASRKLRGNVVVIADRFNRQAQMTARHLCAAALSVLAGVAAAQQSNGTPPTPTADCTVSALNRTAPLQSDYSFTIYNIPGAGAITGPASLTPPPPPPFRVRVSCSDGTVGETALAFPEFGSTVVYTGEIFWRAATPIPLGLSLSAAATRLSSGQTTQLSVTGILADASTVDLSRRDKGTLFTSSNPDLATVGENGLVSVNALFASGSSSRVVMAAQNEGVQATTVLNLGPRGSLGGRVLRADGVTPVANAQVSVLRNQPRETVATVVTDATGSYSIADVSAGQFSVSVVDPATGDLGSGYGSVQAQGEAGVIDVRLNGQGTVTVKVTDGASAPVANAPVTFTSLTGLRDLRTVATDGSGTVVFSAALAGAFTVSTRDASSGLVGTGAGNLPVGGSVVVPLKLQPVGSIAGVVLGSDGTTLQEGVQVRLVSLTRGIVSQVVTGTDGAFRFDTLPLSDSPYTLDAMRDGRLKARVPGLILSSAGQVLGQNVQFAAAGMVRGVVRLGDGSVMADAKVTVQSLAGQRFSFSAQTDAQGRYAVDGVPVGAFSITAAGTGGESASSGGSLTADGQVVDIDLQLASNGLVGTVYLRDGTTPVGAGVTVQMNPGNRSAQTNAAGQFGFTLTQPNSYTIEANDGQGNRGRTSLVVTAIDPEHPASVKVVFLAQGSVFGTVRDPSGASQPGVAVTLNSASLFGGTQSTTADASGRYSFSGVFAGDLTVGARNSATALSGYASARITADGQAVQADISLAATGTVSGRVFRSNGSTPVGGVQLSLRLNDSASAAATTVSDASGNYSFASVPVGEFTVEATDLATGDRGRSGSRVTTAGETRVLNLQMLGQGSVAVTARTTAGTPVEGAVVTLNSNSLFGGSFTAVTDASGSAAFAKVFNGDFSVSAIKGGGSTRLSATTQGTVANGAQASVVLTMSAKAVGRIAGFVTKGVNATPVSGVTVQLRRQDSDSLSQQVVTGPDGAYAFEAVEGETTWRLSARVNERVRARIDGLTISSDGETINRNLALLGAGAVKGRTLSVAGQPLSGIRVEVNQPDPIYGARITVTSQADGSYSVSDVPAGNFTVSARNSDSTLQAQSSGTVRFDADSVTVDLTLVDNAVTMPRTLYEANQNPYTVEGNGSLSGGTSGVFGSGTGADVRASRLELVVGGAAVPFANGDGSVGRSLMDGQLVEVDETQSATGLHVTRRTFVPKDGYFARHLEVLENLGSTPVTVGVRITSNFTQGVVGSRVVDSSDNDAVVSVSDPVNRDRWVVVDDDRDADPFVSGGIPATAVVFDGAGASAQIGAAGTQTVGSQLRLSYEWTSVTVQPGQSVGFMHFVAQQLGRIPAREAALRLAQLPPEALQGLSAEELAIIRNFNVPADGHSAVAALPAVAGSKVSGQVLAGDGRTAIGGATVVLQGQQPLYARRYSVQADSDGRYSFATGGLGTSTALAIAQDRVQLHATHPKTGAATAASTASFATGNPLLQQDLIFVGTGNLRGVVKRHTGTLVSGGTVSMFYPRGNSGFYLNADIGADGSYSYTGIDPRNYTINAQQPHPQGMPVVNALPVQVAVPAGETTVQDIVLQPTGTVTGVVRDAAAAPVAGVRVELDPGLSQTYRVTTTDTGGRYRFDDVATGPHAVSALGNNNTSAGSQVGVEQDGTAVSDLTLDGLGTARVLVQYQRGANAPGVLVTWSPPAGPSGHTDSTGVIPLTLRVGVNYTVRAYHPDNSNLYTSSTVALSQTGEVSDFSIALPAAGSLAGTVVRDDGVSLASGVRISVRNAATLSEVQTQTTDNAGRYVARGLVPGSYLVTAEDRTNLKYADGTFEITSDGQEVAANLRLQDNRIALPSKLFDANRFGFELRANASYRPWMDNYTSSVLDATAGGSQLEINGIAFSGNSSALLEAGRRQLSVSQADPIAGLNVTRKIYVPRGGYFSRYLEILENPTGAPITVGVRLKNRFGSSSLNVVDSSSGDSVLATAGASRDLWLTVDDSSDEDPFTSGSYPAVTTVLADASAAALPDQLSFTATSQPDLATGWSTVTVPANGRVALMHFEVRQVNRGAARASAERLSQLPPEALQFLTEAERNAIVNFTIPADGVSLLEPLPSLLGTVSGRVLEGDQSTPVSGANINVRSLHPLFGRTWAYSGYCSSQGEATLRADATGAYSLRGRLEDVRSVPLPVDAPVEVFSARQSCEYSRGHPLTYVDSPSFVAPFDEQLAQLDVVFETGILTGTVTGPADYGAGSGVVTTVVGQNQVEVSLAGDGTYVLPGMPEGSYTLSATVYHDQGTNLIGSRAGTPVTLGQVTVADIALEPTGSILGVVTSPSGEPAFGADVDIARTGGGRYVSRFTSTDSLGRYTLTAVPVGTYSVTVTDPRTNARTTTNVTVSQNQALTHNVMLIGTASMQLQVNFARGVAAANANVWLSSPSLLSEQLAGRTDALGRVNILIPVGSYSLRVTHPDLSTVKTTVAGTVATHNEVLTATATLPALASVRLTVVNADAGNSVVSGASLRVTDALRSNSSVGSTNGSGQFLVPTIPEGSYSISARMTDGQGATVLGAIVAADDGKTLDRTATISAANDLVGVLGFGDERQLYSVQLAAGDHLTVRIGGAQAGQTAPITLVRTEVYDPLIVKRASGYGYGPNNNYEQYSDLNDLRDIVAATAGTYTVAVAPYSTSYTGGFRLDLAVNGTGVTAQAPVGTLLTGRALTGAGAPLAGQRLRIRAYGAPGMNVERVTDASGGYRVDGVPAGAVEIRRVTGTNTLSAVLASTTIAAGTPQVTLDAAVPTTMTINVTVRNAAGTPVANSRVSFSPPGATLNTNAAGQVSYTYTGSQPVVVRATHPDNFDLSASQTVPAQDGTVNVALSLTSASLSGTVQNAAGQPVAGAYVWLRRVEGVQLVTATYTNASGVFSFPAIPAGEALQVVTREEQTSIYVLHSLTPAGGESVTGVVLRLPASGGMVQGNVMVRGKGVSNQVVRLSYVIDPLMQSTMDLEQQTDVDGYYGFYGLPVGVPITASTTYRVYNSSSGRTLTQNLSLPSVDAELQVDFNLTDVSGGVLALRTVTADGEPGPGQSCVYEVTSGQAIESSSPSWCPDDVLMVGVPAGPVSIKMEAENFWTRNWLHGTAEAVAVDGEVTSVTVPISVVRGKVRHIDGVEAAYPYMSVTLENGEEFIAGQDSDELGNYRLYGLPAGRIRVEATDGQLSGLRQTIEVNLSGVVAVNGADITLPPSGTVQGILRDAQGVPLPNAPIYVRSSGVDLDRYVESGADGSFQVPRVALGNVSLFARDGQTGLVAVANGVLNANGQVLTLNAALPAAATLSGRILFPDNTPAPFAQLSVRGVSSTGPFGPFTGYTEADATGSYRFAILPAGELQVSAEQSNVLGSGSITTTAGGLLTLDVRLGDAVRLPKMLEGADSSRYDVTCEGQLGDGGYGQASDAYDNAYALIVGNSAYPCQSLAETRQQLREFVLPVTELQGLRTQRRIYVPQAGGYARYLESFVNQTANPIVVPVQIFSNLGSDGATRMVVAPASNGGRYAVTSDNGADPALAHIFGGAGTAAGVQAAFSQSGADGIAYRWTITVPPGSRVSLLHFAVQAAAGDTASASARAQALSDGLQAGMYDGLDAADRASIINFIVPQ